MTCVSKWRMAKVMWSILVVSLILLLGIQTAGASDAGFSGILLSVVTFDGFGTDPEKEWVISDGPGDRELYGDFERAAMTKWSTVGATISRFFEVPEAGEYAVWARHFNLLGEDRNYNLNFTVVVVQNGQILFERRFAEVSQGGWDVWMWTTVDETVHLEQGEAAIAIVASGGAEHHRGIDAILLTPDLSFDPNAAGLRLP